MARISRRDLLARGALASAVAGAFAASGAPLLAQGRRGGRLRAGLSGGKRSDSWDMRAPAGLFMLAAAQGAVFDGLTEIAADGTLRGELAQSWESHDAARVWDFVLRSDVSFHDGTAFTSDDVIASLALHRDGASPAAPVVGQIAAMQALGADRLRITLSQGNANFPYLLSHPHLVIYPHADIAAAMARGIGTGLYRVSHFAPGARLLAERVSDHYKGDGAGFADQIEFLSLPTSREQMGALRGGQVDLVDQGAAPLKRGLRLRDVQGQRLAATACGLDISAEAAQECIGLSARVAQPETLGTALPMDNARFAERWWLA